MSILRQTSNRVGRASVLQRRARQVHSTISARISPVGWASAQQQSTMAHHCWAKAQPTISRICNIMLVSFMLFFNTTSGFANTLYPLDTPKQTAQFHHLLRELRCMVCQNQDLSDSNAGLAKDLRQEVYQLVKDGQSDHDIISYLTARYGDFILFNPPVKSITALLWYGPCLFLGVGLLIFWNTCLRRTRHE